LLMCCCPMRCCIVPALFLIHYCVKTFSSKSFRKVSARMCQICFLREVVAQVMFGTLSQQHFFLHMGRHHCKLRSLTLVVFESWSCNASEVQKLKSHTHWDGQNQHVQCWLGGVLELRHCSRDAFHQFCFQKHGGTEQNARPILALPGNTLREDALHQLKHILCDLIFTDHIRLQYFYTKIISYLNVTHGNTISICNSSWCSTPEFHSQICKASILDPCQYAEPSKTEIIYLLRPSFLNSPALFFGGQASFMPVNHT
jgi:hypothetical protein